MGIASELAGEYLSKTAGAGVFRLKWPAQTGLRLQAATADCAARAVSASTDWTEARALLPGRTGTGEWPPGRLAQWAA